MDDREVVMTPEVLLLLLESMRAASDRLPEDPEPT